MRKEKTEGGLQSLCAQQARLIWKCSNIARAPLWAGHQDINTERRQPQPRISSGSEGISCHPNRATHGVIGAWRRGAAPCLLEWRVLRGETGSRLFLMDAEWKVGFPASSAGKESTCSAGDPGSIPGSGRSPGEGIGYPL